MEVVLLVWNPFLTPKSGMLRVLCQCRNPWGGFLLYKPYDVADSGVPATEVAEAEALLESLQV